MKSLRRCRNKCIFCFIDQMPSGLRPTLYVKDDDFMHSFLHGNYITLTNLSSKEIDSIISHMMEPLYISIHSLDPAVREKVFGISDSMKALEHFKRLDINGIHTNIQIVLMPGINDGEDLKHTIEALVFDYQNILSIGIVPVGTTKYNRCSQLKPVEKEDAEKTISLLKDLSGKYGGKVSDKVFLSDEFYLLSGYSIPDYDHYGNFPQISNGIGKSADFLDTISKSIRQVKKGRQKKYPGKKILVLTSEYGDKILQAARKTINRSKKYSQSNLDASFEIMAVKNNFFGGNVKVTGLLTGTDVLNIIDNKKMDHYFSILVPDCIFNDKGVTLDGYSREDIISQDNNISIISEDGRSFLKALYSLPDDGREV